MSATAATARYVVTADDKTKGAIASAISGFRGMERNVKATVNRMNAALGLVGGVAIKRALQNVFTETAKHSKEFAYALDDVKRSARDLLAAKEGAPAATAAMRELAEVLKDPDVVAAADAITSAFIRGSAGAIKFAVGAKSVRQQIEELKKYRAELAKQGDDRGPRSTFIKGEPQFAGLPPKDERLARYDAAIGQLEGVEAAAARRLAEAWQRVDAAGDRATQRFQTMKEFQENIKFLEEIEKKLSDGPSGDKDFFAQLSREGEITAVKARTSFFDRMDEAAQDVGETISRTGDSIAEVGDRIGDVINKTGEFSVYADQAARDSQQAFADYLFDPFDKGARGMLKGFVDVLRRMVAEASAAQIFETLFGKGKNGESGAGNLISSFLGGLFGSDSSSKSAPPKYATGTDYVPRDQLAFVHKGEKIIPASRNRGGDGVLIHAPLSIDARGSTKDGAQELMKAMPEILRKHGDQIESRIVQRLRSGRYA